MIAVIQRCSRGKVTVANNNIGEIGPGLVIFLGVKKGDSETDADLLVQKIVHLRIFNDKDQKMNHSLKDINGAALVISQFTLCGNTKKGRRPSFLNAAAPEKGKELYQYFIDKIEEASINVESGEFGAMMNVELVNDGPVTFVLDSNKL
ncbi:MAG: D-aminoacyl-tRNA deacylase [Candidatus Neomarinimicrobiota bacterium]|nr:D-aminoacyl-tRNA deacylase [Candidatus Neomarinimicrobiota bacterium]